MNGTTFLPCYCINDRVISTQQHIGALVFIALDAICDRQAEYPSSCKAVMRHARLGVANFVLFDICSNHTMSQGPLSGTDIIL